MNLWRLEMLRLGRTGRGALLAGVYLFFGVLGPVTAAYMDEIVRSFGGGVQIEVPDPTPAAAIAQFVSNASQLGLLAVLIVAAGTLAVDAHPEIAAFYRTRGERTWRLLAPRFTVTALAGMLSLVVGTAAAWALTAVLIGAPPALDLVVGTLYGALYIGFVVAVVAAIAGLARSVVMTVFRAVAVAILLPIFGLVEALESWLPSELVGAVAAMVEGAPATDYVRAAAVTVVVSAVLLAVANYRFSRREL